MQFSDYAALTEWIALHWHDPAALQQAQATLSPFVAQQARCAMPQEAESWRTDGWTVPQQSSTGAQALQAPALRWLESPADAQILVQASAQSDELDLSGLTDLSAAVAHELAQYAGTLRLSGLSALTPDLAQALASHRGLIRLDGLHDLRYLEPLAQRQIPREPAGPSVAQPGLSLRAKTSLSVEEAYTLSHVQGELDLSGLQDITPALATALSRRHAHANLPMGWLRLDGWQKPGLEALQALVAAYSGPLSLALEANTALNACLAVLAKHPRDGLALPRLQSLSVSVCQRLAEVAVREMRLNGVLNVDRPCALVLAKAPWAELQLNAIQTMTQETAVAFLLQNEYGTTLLMDGLQVSPELCKTLQKHEHLDGALGQRVWV